MSNHGTVESAMQNLSFSVFAQITPPCLGR